MNIDPMLPAPAYDYDRKRTESRRIQGPGKSEYIITHRHGSEYQKQSLFASTQPQSFRYAHNNFEPRRRHAKDNLLLVRKKSKGMDHTTSISSSSRVSSREFLPIDQHSPRALNLEFRSHVRIQIRTHRYQSPRPLRQALATTG